MVSLLHRATIINFNETLFNFFGAFLNNDTSQIVRELQLAILQFQYWKFCVA